MKSRSIQPDARHNRFLDDLKAAMWKHQQLPPYEMLAVAAQFVGILIAVQDQTKHTQDAIMDTVGKNIEVGNATYIEIALGQTGGKA